MTIQLTDTNAAKIASALLHARRDAGTPSMGMVLTLVVVTSEKFQHDAMQCARKVSREHPSRMLGVIYGSARGAGSLDAEIRIGEGGAGEEVLLRMSGELTRHSESVVLPLLLPDSPVVVWWPSKAPDDVAADPLGALAQRRITDMAAMTRGRSGAMLTQARNYAPGNTDLSWTRLTPWRALLAAALDQYPATIKSGKVAAERSNPSADLLIAWLTHRLKVKVERVISSGPGITSVTLLTGGGEIEIARPDGRLAEFSIPNAPNRPVALKRRSNPELLAEELRRLDVDDVYEQTVKALCRMVDKEAKEADRQASAKGTSTTSAASDGDSKSARKSTSAKPKASKSAGSKAASSKSAGSKSAGSKSAGSKSAGSKSTSSKSTSSKSTSSKAKKAATAS